MARLGSLPDPAVIRQLRGVIDFAVTRGTPYARAWPRKAAHFTPGTLAAAETFARLSEELNNTGALQRTFADFLTGNTKWTWKDLWTRCAYQNLIIEPKFPNPPRPIAVVDWHREQIAPTIWRLRIRTSQPTPAFQITHGGAIVTRPRYTQIRGSAVLRGIEQQATQWIEHQMFNFAGGYWSNTNWDTRFGGDKLQFSFLFVTNPVDYLTGTNGTPIMRLEDLPIGHL